MKIAFTTFPVPGHLNPTTMLARRLKARGHDVVFIGVADAEPALRAAQLPFMPYAEKEFPAGSTRAIYDRLSTLEGQAGLEFTVRAIGDALRFTLSTLPQTLLEARVDGLVLDEAQFGFGLVPMRLGMPYVHYSSAVHFDFSGNAPLCVFDWHHETTPDALARNRKGLRIVGKAFEPGRTIARLYMLRSVDFK